MPHICAACKMEQDKQESDQKEPGGQTLPQGWFLRCIDETDYVLCDVCGASIHFRGAISPYLTQALGLMEGARCDMSAEAMQLGRKRRKLRNCRK